MWVILGISIGFISSFIFMSLSAEMSSETFVIMVNHIILLPWLKNDYSSFPIKRQGGGGIIELQYMTRMPDTEIYLKAFPS